MLSRRHVTMAASYTKQVKAERLRVNDKLDRDMGNSDDSMVCGILSAVEGSVNGDILI